MLEGYVYSRTEADEANLRDTIQRLRSELTYVVQTRVEDIAFDALPEDGLGALWPEGRTFGPRAEVRWRQTQPGRFDLLLLSETRRDPGDDWANQSYQVRDQWPDGRPLRVYLWGIWQTAMNAWVEVRIPRPLPYPVTPPDPLKQHRIYITAAEYAQNGMVRFIRWKMLEMEEV